MGAETRWVGHDHEGARPGVSGTCTLTEMADLVVMRFAGKISVSGFARRDAALGAGHAAAIGTPRVVVRDDVHQHPLEGVDRPAQTVELRTRFT